MEPIFIVPLTGNGEVANFDISKAQYATSMVQYINKTAQANEKAPKAKECYTHPNLQISVTKTEKHGTDSLGKDFQTMLVDAPSQFRGLIELAFLVGCKTDE